MWTRRLGPVRSNLSLRPPTRARPKLPNTRNNASLRHQSSQPPLPHTTYFQQPPPPPPSKPSRRILSATLFTLSGFLLGGLTYAYSSTQVLALSLDPEADPNNPLGDPLAAAAASGLIPPNAAEVLSSGLQSQLAKECPALNFDEAMDLLRSRSVVAVGETTISHICQVPSNLPCEDTWSSGTYNFHEDPGLDWEQYSVFDGHAGGRTSAFLQEKLPPYVGFELWQARVMGKAYVPNDGQVREVIRRAFLNVDRHILEEAERHVSTDFPSRTEAVAAAAAAFSGSCALMALVDPARKVLRVMNVGDSRAVLGRWDEGQKRYVVREMSTDQKGFDQGEVERMSRDHPGEDVIDPKTGRVFGIAVTRAFGDARWKWTEALTRRAHELLWGPPPRPGGVIKTPPYLTAEPEITETRIQTGPSNPDFLIMASDGLWDLMSSEDAVECVQMWLDEFSPTDTLNTGKMTNGPFSSTPIARGILGKPKGDEDDHGESRIISESRGAADRPPLDDEDEDTFYDAEEKCMQWRVSPKHFVVEDEHCGIHLIKNALGGKRRGLFTSVLSVQPPLSRNVRDDITVQVIFFGSSRDELVKKGLLPERMPAL